MKTVENLPFSYGIGKDLKRELKVAKATIKARVREAQRQRVSDALRLSVLSYDQNLDAFALQRVCAVSLVVDFGDESKAQGELLVKETKRSDHKTLEGQSIAAIASSFGKDPLETYLDLCVAEDCAVDFDYLMTRFSSNDIGGTGHTQGNVRISTVYIDRFFTDGNGSRIYCYEVL